MRIINNTMMNNLANRNNKLSLLVLWNFVPHYLSAELNFLATEYEITIVHLLSNDVYPYNLDVQLIDPISRLNYDENWEVIVSKKDWDLILCCGTSNPRYRRFLRKNRKSTRILYTDSQITKGLFQKFRVLLGKMVIKIWFDAAFVPGARQFKLVKKLGFNQSLIGLGALSFDDSFAKENPSSRRAGFIFVGRIAKEKRVEVLLEAYQIYRNESKNPSILRIVGPTDNLKLDGLPEGVVYLGFLEKYALANELLNSSIFVFPSAFEPWGVALLEAAAAGCILISTDAVGSSDDLITDVNGITVKVDNAHELAMAMLKLDSWDERSQTLARETSREMAKQFNLGSFRISFNTLVANAKREAAHESAYHGNPEWRRNG